MAANPKPVNANLAVLKGSVRHPLAKIPEDGFLLL
jgi:hypothetical protein